MQKTDSDRAGVNTMTFRGLFRVKSLDAILEEAEEPEHKLKRALGPVALTLFGIGAIIGAGIFATIGTAAAGDAHRLGAGPALILSFVITAVVCGFTALCYAEFASMVPISGSAYTYSYATLGEVVAWIIGWDLIIEYAVGNIGVAISWANYFKTLLANLKFNVVGNVMDLSIKIPDWISTDYRTAHAKPEIIDSAPHIFGIPIVFNLLAVSIVAAITIVLVWGVRESARFNAVMVGIKIIVLTFFIVFGTMYIDTRNWHLPNYGFAPNGFPGISSGAAIVFFAYIGFDAVSTVAEETRNPQRNLPIGIIASLIICTIFYVIVGAVFTGLVPYPVLVEKQLSAEQAEPLTMAIQYAVPNAGWAVGIVAFGSVIAHTAVLLVFQLGQPRIFFSMARDGLLPPIFYKVHPRFRTPHISTILTGVFVAVFAAFASIDEMVDLTNIGTLFAFVLVCAGIIILRVKDPDRVRPFRVPGGWRWTITLYIAFAIAVFLFPETQLPIGQKIMWLVGAAIVFALSRKYIFPVLGVISCLYLIYFLPPTSWLRFAAWLNFGFVIYVGYGSVKSRLTGRHLAERPAEHDAQTAFTGMWLAIIGALLLLIMRAFDIYIAAGKWLAAVGNSTPDDKTLDTINTLKRAEPWLQSLVKGDSALAGIFNSGAWLERSFFLIIPLALNAFVLCPIVIRRAMRARNSPDAERYAVIANTSLYVTAALAAVSIAYLIAVFVKS
ncbi:MAG TPA: amino acid permease [Blastocatellia bacterium]|nr:amino acid permease [Blastocatellia bacterium]